MIRTEFTWLCEICYLPSLGSFTNADAAQEGLNGHIKLWHPETLEEK